MKKIITFLIIQGLLLIVANSCVDLSIGDTDNHILIRAIEDWKGDYQSGDNKFSEKDICQNWTFKTGHMRYKHEGEWLEYDQDTYSEYGLNLIKGGDFIKTVQAILTIQDAYDTFQETGKWLYKDNVLAYAVYRYDGILGYVSVFEVIEVTKNKLTLKEYIPNDDNSQVLTLEYERQSGN